MDNCFCYIPASSFASGASKFIIADSVFFVAKCLTGLYYLMLSFRANAYYHHKLSKHTYFWLGLAVIVLSLLRIVLNWWRYRKLSHFKVTGIDSSHLFCSRIFLLFKTWIIIAFINIGISIVFAAVNRNHDVWFGLGVTFVFWELISFICLSILQHFLNRHFIRMRIERMMSTVTDSSTNA